MIHAYLLLGSNRGDRAATLAKALESIEATAGTIVRLSQVYETEPWGFRDETPFLNQVAEISTTLRAEDLMEQLLVTEARLGRIRPFDSCGCGGNAAGGGDGEEPAYLSRTIDIDILFYGNDLIFTERLMVPHPRLHERRFTLVPLCELEPGLMHPLLKKTVAKLLEECPDKGRVSLYIPGSPVKPE